MSIYVAGQCFLKYFYIHGDAEEVCNCVRIKTIYKRLGKKSE